jgi:hypothetical protein
MRWLAAAGAAALLLAQGEADYQSARRKLELIQSERLPLGGWVTLRPQELTAYAQREVLKVAPEGVREPRIQLGHGAATAFAYLDFPKLRRSTGKPLGWLMARLLAGEHPVRVTARIQSGGGQAKVDLERVEIGGLAVEGAALEFLIASFVLPYYPEAMIGRPFALAHRIERLEVRPTEVRVVIGR